MQVTVLESDVYMAGSGILPSHPDHVKRIVEMALERLAAVRSYGFLVIIPFGIRIGINTGPVVAGVIGTTKFIYDLWGDTAKHGEPLGIDRHPRGYPGQQIRLRTTEKRIQFEARGPIEVNGKGLVETWLLHQPNRAPESDSDVVNHPLKTLS